jgi:hypothetical protein
MVFDHVLDCVEGIHASARLQRMVYDHVLDVVGPEKAPQEKKAVGELYKLDQVELLKPAFLHTQAAALQARAQVGFVGMSVPYDKTEVGLNSCVGRWRGCIPTDAPALVYHHGALHRGGHCAPCLIRRVICACSCRREHNA